MNEVKKPQKSQDNNGLYTHHALLDYSFIAIWSVFVTFNINIQSRDRIDFIANFSSTDRI